MAVRRGNAGAEPGAPGTFRTACVQMKPFNGFLVFSSQRCFLSSADAMFFNPTHRPLASKRESFVFIDKTIVEA